VQLAITPAAMQVAVGATSPVRAAVTNLKGEAIDSLSRLVRWTVGDSTIATISDSGVVQGHKLGKTIFTASIGNVKKPLEVEVVQAQVTTLALAPAQVSLVVGGRATLRAVPRDALGNALKRDIMWTSSNPTVAVVAGDGQVIASDTGIANITAIAEGRMANAVVSVKPNAAMIKAAKDAAGAGAADCVAYEPGALKITRDRNIGWIVTDGSNTLLTLDEELDARRAMQLARAYKSHCYLGRLNKRPNHNNYVIEYWTNPSGAQIVVENEDCEPFTPAQLRITDNGAQGFTLLDGRKTLVVADSRDDAQKIWEVAQQHSAQCFIGRGNRRPNQRDYVVQYWR
jgi:Bacterial Ig-like domain (group 2)